MPRKTTLPEFIAKANLVHKDKYSYDKSIYESTDKKLIIICNIHGDFEQTPHMHLYGNGCPDCVQMKDSVFWHRLSTKNHYNNFTYEKSKFVSLKDNITVTCKVCGDLTINAKKLMHLHKGVCPGCRPVIKEKEVKIKRDIKLKTLKIAKTKLQLKEEKYLNFLNLSPIIHNNYYDYSKVEYINSKVKVIIICPEHGEFLQRPNDHLGGHGCSKCNQTSYYSKNYIELHKDKFQAEKSTLYLLLFKNEQESFLKIGISKDFKTRLSVLKRLPYNVDIIDLYDLSTYDALNIEQDVLKLLKLNYKYTNLIKFPGYTELLDLTLLSDINIIIDYYINKKERSPLVQKILDFTYNKL